MTAGGANPCGNGNGRVGPHLQASAGQHGIFGGAQSGVGHAGIGTASQPVPSHPACLCHDRHRPPLPHSLPAPGWLEMAGAALQSLPR